MDAPARDGDGHKDGGLRRIHETVLRIVSLNSGSANGEIIRKKGSKDLSNGAY